MRGFRWKYSTYVRTIRHRIIHINDSLTHTQVDDSNEGTGTHYKFSREYIENTMQAVSTSRFQRQQSYLMDALHDYSVRDHEVVIFGSMEPVFEALALVQGANRTFTIEFNKLTFEHEDMITRTV